MDSTKRFSDRVADYVRYRPDYPEAILSALHVGPDWVVADIGSGTGISTKLFLRAGCRVHAVEPNEEMRAKAEELLSHYPNFVSVNGTAEATGLAAGSFDLIVAGQAFHWFDPVRTRKEMARISRPGAIVALIWNQRLMEMPFEKEYEELILQYAGDYRTINHKNITDKQIGAFFHPANFVLQQFENGQDFDLDGLKGRLLSSSYIPKDGERFDAMIRALEKLFRNYAVNGKVRVRYDTKMYTGVLKPDRPHSS
ncbi:MAG TPA: class I SAM-dependent methyltransferase [Puia sp.]|nr:class I SAM-dependent methyltransferase [Puia sp.]